jgi:hypothetical protein
MKRAFVIVLLVLLPILAATGARAQGNVGIGTTAPNSSALLDLTSTTRGLLAPRMTESQKNAIASPATGLLIYETDTATTGGYAGQAPTFWYFNGTNWVPITGAAWALLGNGSTNPSYNFVGTKDSVDFVMRTRDTERVRIYSSGDMALPNYNNVAEEIRWLEPSSSGSLYTGFKCDTNTSSVTYTWPPADGQATNWVLCTDGFGQLTWRGFSASGGGGIDTMWSRGTGHLALVGHGADNASSGDYSISAGYNNLASGFASVVWGEYNNASGYASVVAGGTNDTASGNYSTVGGGSNNVASGMFGSVVSGQYNTACGKYSIVLGGQYNTACGNYATILGGYGNTVSGNYSLAYGRGASVTTDNTIVYYDSSSSTPMKMGIGTVSPAQTLDVTGNIKFTGALMPNGNAGSSGYVLASTGANSAPVWASTSNLYWSILGNTGTSASSNYLGTSDATDLVFRTNNVERMRVLSSGRVAINTTTTTHQMHSLYTGTTDETAAVMAQASGSTTNQAIGAWGSASSTGSGNTGTIGVLATGNGNSGNGQTNVALQVNDGEFAMGRTTKSPSVGTVVGAAASGTSYSAEGPSGVIELTLGGGNLSTVAPTTGIFQNLGTITINNQYVSSKSAVFVSIVSMSDDGVAPNCAQANYYVDVTNRTSGSFDIRIGMMPSATNISNYSTSDKIRIGYAIINPGR